MHRWFLPPPRLLPRLIQPTSSIIFGAVLRMLDQDSRRGDNPALCEQAVSGFAAYSNQLANTMLELGDDAKASAYYHSALAINSQYGRPTRAWVRFT